METEGSTAGSTLASYLHTLRRRAWILVLCLVLVPAAALFVSERSAKQYQASAEIYANGDDLASILTGIETSSASGNTAENIVYLSLTPRVASRTLRALERTDRSPNYLLSQTSVLQKGGSDFFVVSVTDSDPTGRRPARHRVRAPDHQVPQRTDHGRDRKRPAPGRPQARRSSRPTARTRRCCTGASSQKDQELETLEALQTSRLSVVRTPTRGYQVAPRPKRAAALGIFLALVLGAGLMFTVRGARHACSLRHGDRRAARPAAARPHPGAAAEARVERRARDARQAGGPARRVVPDAAHEPRVRAALRRGAHDPAHERGAEGRQVDDRGEPRRRARTRRTARRSGRPRPAAAAPEQVLPTCRARRASPTSCSDARRSRRR